MGKTASADLTTTSEKFALTQCQPLLWGLSQLHIQELLCNDPKWSYQWSVLPICHCIRLHKYACNASQIWLILACSFSVNIQEPVFYTAMTWLLTVSHMVLGSVQHPTATSNSKCINILLLAVNDPFQYWTCFYSWFERLYIKNHIRSLVSFIQCRLEASYCLE